MQDLKLPKTIQILTNLNCNLNCTYCYENKIDQVNNINSIKSFLSSQLTNSKELTYGANIELIGGESLLYPELVSELTEYALKLGKEKNISLNFSISTNGTLFNNPKVREFVEKYGKYYEIGVSIDGPKEIHDKYRKYLKSKDSTYEAIIPHLSWLFKNAKLVGVKATFTNETIKDLSKAVIHLISLGFTQIGANPAYEYPLSLKDGNRIALELIKIVDYLFENSLEKKINFFQLGNYNDNSQFLNRLLSFEKVERNYCGSGEYMTCLGFNDKIYGCNRFCTMNKPNMTKDNEKLLKEINEHYSLWPDECINCNLHIMCSSCAAAPYEEGKTPKDYFAEKRMCGWTHALALTKLYFQNKIESQNLENSSPKLKNEVIRNC